MQLNYRVLRNCVRYMPLGMDFFDRVHRDWLVSNVLPVTGCINHYAGYHLQKIVLAHQNE